MHPAGENCHMVEEILPTPTVLVVDDEVLIRWSLSEGLSEAGYDVEEAADGREALKRLTDLDGEPCVVLLDLRLPDSGDLSLLSEIRRRRPDVPVVMLTAHGSLDDAAQATALGASAFLNKPFDVSRVIEVVASAWTARNALYFTR